MAKIDDIIGGYRLIAEIGRGGFASVFTGKHIIFHDKPIVAIKVLHTRLASLEQQELLIQEALQEAQLLAQLKHPHILSVLDAGIYERSLYLITEFATNGSLRDRLQRQKSKPFPTAEAIQLLSQIGQALHYAHERNIVHCDLKPDNILFNAKGDALLADFGIAAVLTSGETKDVGRRGTIYYMAPEQFAGKASPKSDQYALGCIAYELFTGQRLFVIPHPSLEVMWYHHAKVEPIAPRQINPQLPVHIEQAILKAVEKERKNRYTTVPVFIAALQKSSQQWLQEGKSFFDHKHYKEAVFAFEQANQLNTKSATIWYIKGFASIMLGHYKDAANAYISATMLDPDLIIAHIAKDVVSHLLELNSYEEVLPTISQMIVYILDQHLQTTSRLVLSQIFKAIWLGLQIIFLKKMDFEMPDLYEDRVLAILDRTIELAPRSSLAYFAKIAILKGLDREEEADDVLDQVVELVPDSLFACLISAFGLTLLDKNEQDAALDQIIELVPDSPLAYFAKVLALDARNHAKEANALLNQVIELVPDSPLAYFAKVFALNVQNRAKETNALLNQVIKLVPNILLAHLAKVFTLDVLDRAEDADTVIIQTVELAPNSMLAHLTKVARLMIMEEKEETLTALNQMVNHASKSPFTYLTKAILLLIQSREKEALTALDQATRLDPDIILAYSLKIFILYGLDRKEETLSIIEQILHLIPSSAIAHSLKTFMLYDLDRKEEALNAIEQVLHLIPSSVIAHLFNAYMLYDSNYRLTD